LLLGPWPFSSAVSPSRCSGFPYLGHTGLPRSLLGRRFRLDLAFLLGLFSLPAYIAGPQFPAPVGVPASPYASGSPSRTSRLFLARLGHRYIFCTPPPAHPFVGVDGGPGWRGYRVVSSLYSFPPGPALFPPWPLRAGVLPRRWLLTSGRPFALVVEGCW